MFCDLVGSTALASRLDLEDLGEVVSAYHHRVAATVARFDGFVAKYMGDGVLVYFGWPLAHEDEAERAVRAGLAIVDALAELETPTSEPLAVRIGIKPVATCSIPSGLAFSQRPTFRRVSSNTRSARWTVRQRQPRPPASVTMRRSYPG
jgi:hypothetical protein